MVNHIFSERGAIANEFTQLTHAPLKTVDDFLRLSKTLQSFSIMFSIVGGKPPFDGYDSHVLIQILDTIQAQVPSLPFSIQSDVNIGLASIQKLIKANAPIDQNLLNVTIAPHFARLCKDSAQHSSDDPVFPAMVATPTRTDPLETAFYSRQDSRPPPRPQGSQDSRPRPNLPDRTAIAPDRRRDSRDPARDSFTQDRTDRKDRTRGTPRPGRADSPEDEIARLQDEISAKQAKLERMKHYHKKALMAQATADAAEDDAHATEHPPHYALTVFPGGYPDSSTSSRSSRRSTASRSS
jgi:hypothetical protein